MSTISPSLHDFTFDFNNSCNCCSTRRIRGETPVYVHEDGSVSAFDHSKPPTPKDGRARALSNLTNNLRNCAIAHSVPPEHFIRAIEDEADLEFTLENPPILKGGTIRKINAVMRQKLQEIRDAHQV